MAPEKDHSVPASAESRSHVKCLNPSLYVKLFMGKEISLERNIKRVIMLFPPGGGTVNEFSFLSFVYMYLHSIHGLQVQGER